MVLTKTYPEHPLSKIKPNAVTRGELADQRKARCRDEVAKENEKVEADRRNLSFDIKSYVKSEFHVDNPMYTSVK